jgi:hypothetical protein
MIVVMDVTEIILKVASENKKFKTADVVKTLENKVSRQHVSFLIKNLVNEGRLVKGGSTANSVYALPRNANLVRNIIKKRVLRRNLKEHEVLDDINRQSIFMRNLKENVRSIFDYSFSEMLNNAIEHSQSEHIELEVAKEKEVLRFTVNDFGIGVFKNVMKQRKLNSELEAIQDLLKGKTTTQPHAHSGEGIFFTSKAADIFILESYGYSLRVDNEIEDVFIEQVKPSKRGTKVSYFINADSRKHLQNIFSRYETDHSNPDFDKTEVQVKLYIFGTIYISRSQARRVLTGLERFKSIIFDFDKVPTIGQAFADEIFRVFHQKYPEIKLTAINMNEAVKYMVDRVGKLSEI